MSRVAFVVLAALVLGSGVGVLVRRNPIHAALFLVVNLASVAGLYLTLHAEFLAAAQVIVYAGAVMVLYVFVVAYVGGGEQVSSGGVLRVLGPLFALGLVIELCIAMLGAGLKGVNTKGAPFIPGFGTPAHIGSLFLTKFLLPFEVASILLLAAAVGAVVLARRRRGLEPDEQIALRIETPRPAWTGTMAEAAGLTGPGQEGSAEPVATAGDPSNRQGGW